MIEALLIVISLHGNVLGEMHLGKPPGKTFASKQACIDWLDSDEGERTAHEMGENLRAVYGSELIRVIPACHVPNEV